MTTTVQKWGNSLALRIPSGLAKDVHLRPGAVVDVAVAEGKIVVNPRNRREYSLSELLKGVKKSNRHAEVGWSRAVGREVW